MRKESCKLIIEDCEELLDQINNKLMESFQSPENKEVSLPKIKSFLEHCRSMLEYTAQDIFELVVPIQERTRKLNSKDSNVNVYFPYGEIKKTFRSSVSRNLPGLKSADQQVYNLVENLQDYKEDKEKVFLTYMCKLTNDNKHDDLSDSQRKSSTYINIGKGAIVVDDKSKNIHINGGSINGTPLGNFSINNGEIHGNINSRILSEIVKYEEGEYVFNNNKRNVIEFLQLCLDEIIQFTDDLYKILESKHINNGVGNNK
jgi:hypothetical protein